MRFKIDENLLRDLADVLRGTGHDVATVHDERPSGADDEHLATVCRSEGWALITFDVGFADIRRYPPNAHAGMIVLRLERQDVLHVLDMVRRLLPLVATEPLGQRLWIVDEQCVQIR